MPVRDIKLDGSFTQDTTGIYQSNLDYKTNVIDHIHATGEGSVSGELLVRIHNRALVDPGQYRRNFFTADLGLINQQSAKGISASNLGPDSQPIALNVYRRRLLITELIMARGVFLLIIILISKVIMPT